MESASRQVKENAPHVGAWIKDRERPFTLGHNPGELRSAFGGERGKAHARLLLSPVQLQKLSRLPYFKTSTTHQEEIKQDA
jgi:hypothetical protein